MTHYFIDNREGVGYVVMYATDWQEGCASNGSILNFGDRQSDAIEFRDDCRRGTIAPNRIKALADKYTDKNVYRYLGEGRVHKV